jgi:hypothetical protein
VSNPGKEAKMPTRDEIRTWCYGLGDGRLEENGIEVEIDVGSRTGPSGLSGFSIGLHSRDGKAAEFNLASKLADVCIRQGKCDKWKKRLHAAIDEASSGWALSRAQTRAVWDG